MNPGGGPMDGDERLIQGWIDQELDAHGLARLERWLAADPAHRRRFLLETHLHDQLGQLGQQRQQRQQRQQGATPARPRPRLERRPRRRRRPARSLALGIAAAAVVMLGLGIWLATAVHQRAAQASPPMPQQVAHVASPYPSELSLVSARGCLRVRAGVRATAEPGALLGADVLETASGGAAELRLADGSQLQLGSDARLAITNRAALEIDPDHAALRLERGSLECEIAKQQAPLCLATQNALVRVLGTHLLIACDGIESTVAVTRGRVEIRPQGAAAGALVMAGQRGLVPASGAAVVRAADAPWGRLLRVGPHEQIATLARLPALEPGDVVEIAAGTYHEARRWTESGTAVRPIIIRPAAGERPLIDGDGVDLSGKGAVPRALFQLEGSHLRVEGLAFARAANHENAAGVRILGAADIAIVGCAIQACDDGITGEGDGIRIEGCRITDCGTADHEGYCHDCYIDGGSSLEIRGSVLTRASHGQALKCAAHRILIEGCRLGWSQDGEVSFLDPPDGARADDAIEMIGDVVESSQARTGNHQRFIELDAEAGHARLGTLVLAYDTLAAADPRTRLLDIAQGAVRCIVVDSILDGTAPLIIGGSSEGEQNWLPAGVPSPGGWLRSQVGASDDPGFLSRAAGDLRLGDGASIGAAAVPLSEARSEQDLRPPLLQPPVTDNAAATTRQGWRDLGAYERGQPAGPPLRSPAP